ncbi:E3 ubiquitin-protein ligase COP1 isoform X2 [Anolis carolinensis]|uniref:E3 ubiquitin-protein ligase COP1 isoform X2 n=1 Tax=Anolis carolinensis TaxID=28377 RepID=UPI0007DB7E98|nr:PREDICTED: E3 ubiquitin-protein ligase RFWD2 isoform X2 [Anolis carolinensis]|eukprot:XP_008107155.2 PREDICTED: E3 ubiquitin-protein ligase RFWD2 isoform X2 [Anolis carolinensis]
MSGSRQPPQHSAAGPPPPGSSSPSVTTSASSATAAAAPGASSSSSSASVGLGAPARPVLVAAAASGSSSSSAGLARLAGGGRAGSGGAGSANSSSSSSRKRPLLTPLCNGLLNSYEDKSNDFVCPICFDMIEEAYMTKCGHSFCYKCIHQSLEDNNRCPKCNYVVDNIDHLYPNFLVNELILKQKQRFDEKRFKLDHSNGHRWQIFQDLLGTDQDNLDLANVNLMLELLVQKKKQLEAESHAAQLQILIEFLKVARRNKKEQLEQIQKELSVLEEDIKRVEEMSGLYSPVSEDSTVPQFEAPSPSPSSIIDSTEYSQPPGFSGSSQTKKQPWYNSTLASRRKRLTAHFEDLEQCYFSTRMTRVSDDSRTSSQLDEFQECLSKFTRYNSVRPLATLSYASDLYNGSSIVSSIEFDRDCDYFAIAGVTKKIKVYEYGTVIQDAVDIHYPENEMTCNSKISCISWSSYHKNLLASSDYEGTVILWDGFTGQRSKVYQEHEKRCWSVDFNLMDPKLLASGSDDAKVKLWSTNLDNSVASIEAKANVCCVKFSPSSRYHLAFGCADHCVHYYDLRNTKQPIMVFKGHRKAVSYAKFVSGEEIVSASTDSQLKLWNVGKPHCLRSFKGHINEKNFVGLASNGDYIACGSENNSLYLYYKGLSKTLLTFKFDTVKSVLDKDRKEDDTNEFVSAVCWRALPDGESNVLIAANSQGTIKVLELV